MHLTQKFPYLTFFVVLFQFLFLKNYFNGDYGFDPLGLKPTDENEYNEFIAAELNHGRLAMIAFLGMLAQEYSTGLPITAPLVL